MSAEPVRYWSEVDRTYLEGEVICFTGPQAVASLTGEGWQQRELPHATRFGGHKGQLLSRREVAACPHLWCGCGRRKTAPAKTCLRCYRQARARAGAAAFNPRSNGPVVKAHCRGCRRQHLMANLSAKHRLCGTCLGRSA